MFRLHIGRPCGFCYEAPDQGSQLLLLGMQIGAHNVSAPTEEKIRVTVSQLQRHRIPIARNLAVRDALEEGATHLLFMDPDICPDRYLGQPWAKPWWQTFWRFMRENPGSVIAAPYCGRGENPRPEVLVNSAKPETCHRVTREESINRHGWERVAAVGTGLMLIDMSVFERLPIPWFHDDYQDQYEFALRYTPDYWFCALCEDAGIPVYVNWDCWCGHWQNQVVESPLLEGSFYRESSAAATKKQDSPQRCHEPSCAAVAQRPDAGGNRDAVCCEAASGCLEINGESYDHAGLREP